MLKQLQEKNPQLKLYSVEDDAFSEYGRVISDYRTEEIIQAAKEIPMPEEGSSYLPSVDAFEKLTLAQTVQEDIFGCLPTQMGYTYGHSNFMNAMEWHCCSELNVAVTPLVMLLAKRSDLQSGKLDSSQVKAFYLPAGTVVEVYATTLHFCPLEVMKEGFGCVVGLLKGTNLPHEEDRPDKLMFRQNKWLLAHNENQTLLDKGCVPGISGVNYQLHY